MNNWLINLNDIEINYNKILGKGEYSIVYEGVWNNLKVAIKYFNNSVDSSKKIYIYNELHLLLKIRHPNIINIFGYCENPLMIIMEFVEKQNLYKHISKFSVSPFLNLFKRKTKESWCKDLCLSLSYLHNKNIIHRDLKPSNVLIDKNNILKLADFGISKIKNNLYSQNIGTYYYMAPELLSNKEYNHKIDIWSLGLIFYEIWEGHKWISYNEFQNSEELKNYLKTNKVQLYFNKTPKNFRKIIIKCIDADPKKRPESKDIYNLII